MVDYIESFPAKLWQNLLSAHNTNNNLDDSCSKDNIAIEPPNFIDRSRIKSPVSGIDTLRVTEVENTLEDDIDESRRGEDRDFLARVIPSIKNSGVTMRTSNNLNLYSRPGPVENHDLL